MVYTKEEFKRLWDSSSDGGGITNDDCADCAKAWGICSNPRCMQVDTVVYLVCKAANVKDMPERDDDDERIPIDAKTAWKVYNFVNAYKNAEFGFVTLQEALDKHFDDWQQPEPLKEQTGAMV